MPRQQTRYLCQSCGHASPRWLGKCPECEGWSTFVEEAVPRAEPARRVPGAGAAAAPITAVAVRAEPRIVTGIAELDRVLGGGIVPGSVVLVGGDPGIGKSTLMTQMAVALCTAAGACRRTVLFASGEESAHQLRLRAERLGALPDTLLVVTESDMDAILGHVAATGADAVVVDSIQTTRNAALESAPGTVSQIRDCAAALARAAKAGGPPIFLVGHVTKEGALAGPKVLEHMVDTVLYFEGDRHQAYRILRAAKNRFGSTDEIGLFEMGEGGLAEVQNPSVALLSERATDASGSAVAATVEGTRPLLVEVQALVSRSPLANPRRSSTGIDYNRVNMLLAVLEKRVGLRLADQDVFVNVAGGVRLVEPAADLALAVAVASNFRDQAVHPTTVMVGEVGLSGEVRAVAQVEKRLREAARLGFTRALIGRGNARGLAPVAPRGLVGLEVVPVSSVNDALAHGLLPARPAHGAPRRRAGEE
ncbi:MAG: DNA repair protein RadA [Chthonomonadales bacterium]|nr:DNA repair protein RadA [Chthonomonadales bacterium]